MGGYVGFTPFVLSRRGHLEFKPADLLAVTEAEKNIHESKARYFKIVQDTECHNLIK
jgi:hypothetical protein